MFGWITQHVRSQIFWKSLGWKLIECHFFGMIGAKRSCYELLERIKHCSPLGGLLRGLQTLYADRDGQTAGIGTIRRLESAGIESMRQVASMSVSDLVQIGVQRRYALQIRRYVERRLR